MDILRETSPIVLAYFFGLFVGIYFIQKRLEELLKQVSAILERMSKD